MSVSRNELKKKIKKIAYEAQLSNNNDIAHILNQLCDCMDDKDFYAMTVDRPVKNSVDKDANKN
tara:strand:- start:17472 stop:17663 length:192 start_codon:yes stop_codon:yes gene_type:complete